METDFLGERERGGGIFKESASTLIGSSGKVLLRSPEGCRECGVQFKSLYPLRRCLDHMGLENI